MVLPPRVRVLFLAKNVQFFPADLPKNNTVPWTFTGSFKARVQNSVTRYIRWPVFFIWVFGSFQHLSEPSEGLSVSSVSALSSARLILLGIADQMKRSRPCDDAQIVWPCLCSSNPLSSQSSSLARSFLFNPKLPCGVLMFDNTWVVSTHQSGDIKSTACVDCCGLQRCDSLSLYESVSVFAQHFTAQFCNIVSVMKPPRMSSIGFFCSG